MKCVYKKCMNSVIVTNHGHKVSNVALVYNCKFNTAFKFYSLRHHVNYYKLICNAYFKFAMQYM